MSSIVLVFSMLSLGRILISNLVVPNLLMYSLPGMILLYLAAPFLHLRCFCMRSYFLGCFRKFNLSKLTHYTAASCSQTGFAFTYNWLGLFLAEYAGKNRLHSHIHTYVHSCKVLTTMIHLVYYTNCYTYVCT